MKKREIEFFITETDKVPFLEWFEKLDKKAQATIDNYISRVAKGGCENNIKPIQNGIFEIKIHYGPGFRVYFGELNRNTILLLLGGNKGTQKRDIIKANRYWRKENA